MNNQTQTNASAAGTAQIYFAANRHTNRAVLLTGFSCWEEIQGAFRCGIQLPDGTSANGIGRCKSVADFVKRANKGRTTILVGDDQGLTLEVEINGHPSKVSSNVWRSYTGKRWLNGAPCDNGDRFYWLSNEIAA